MGHNATDRWGGVLLLVGTLASFLGEAQNVPEWRHIGNAAIDMALPAVATGPVDRVWFSADGSVLYARSRSGRTFQTNDFEQWRLSTGVTPPREQNSEVLRAPEANLRRVLAANAGRAYAIGASAYRSDDGGVNWANLTDYKGVSILGGRLADLAISPRDADEIAVASATGIWHSADGGLSWTGINQFLPNLAAGRMLAVPNGLNGVRLALQSADLAEIEWAPGEKSAWRPHDNSDLVRDSALRASLSQVLKRSITAVAAAGSLVYAGDSDGRLFATSDQGNTWNRFNPADAGPVEAIWVDPKDARLAVAALGARANAPIGSKPIHVLRTMNGGLFWDDITAGLPESAAAHGVVADRASGAIYVATDDGVFYTMTDLRSAGRPSAWTVISTGLPAAAAMDVALDAGGNQLYALLDGYGVYAAMAPHRFREAQVVNAADFSSRPAAPGSLLSVLGTRVQSVVSTSGAVPVLAASEAGSQIQVPFEAKGSTVAMTLEVPSGRLQIGMPLLSVSPAIFIDPDGTPLILDADTGTVLDTTRPAHSGTRIQVLATGLGRVKPDWPTGVAAPVNDPPKVIAAVRAYLDATPVEVTQAVLAPYIGFYLVEIQLPRILNSGPAEFYLQADGQQSNKVRVYIEP
jgi:uncharacterized protein (TIGR03437 family)